MQFPKVVVPLVQFPPIIIPLFLLFSWVLSPSQVLLRAYVRHGAGIGVNGVPAAPVWHSSWLLLLFFDAPLLLPSFLFSSKPSWCCFPPEAPPELSLVIHLPEVLRCCHLQLSRFPVLLYSSLLCVISASFQLGISSNMFYSTIELCFCRASEIHF